MIHVKMNVHPKFLTKMKITAAKKNKSIIGLTKEMAEEDELMIDFTKMKKQKKNGYKFNF